MSPDICIQTSCHAYSARNGSPRTGDHFAFRRSILTRHQQLEVSARRNIRSPILLLLLDFKDVTGDFRECEPECEPSGKPRKSTDSDQLASACPSNLVEHRPKFRQELLVPVRWVFELMPLAAGLTFKIFAPI